MEDGGSSPLFVPQGTQESKSSPSHRGKESGSGNGIGTDMVRVKSEHNTPEFKSNPPGPHDPKVKIEQSPSPPPPPPNAFGRTESPRPFAPFTSRTERNRRNIANESLPAVNALASTALEASSRDMQTAVQLATPAARNASIHTEIARAAVNGQPNQALASTALATGSRDLLSAVEFAKLAASNSAMHNDVARHALRGDRAAQSGTQGNAAPHGPQPAQPANQAATPFDLLRSAHHHLDVLSTKLHDQENDACDREERLTTLRDQARDVRLRAIQDRKNGLIIIRDRYKKLRELEQKLIDKEEIDGEEMLELLRPLKLDEPVEREMFERMELDDKEYEHQDGYESGHYDSDCKNSVQ